ncbi:maleylpyruvate isomerase family mycothiol-dependent enzyme [Streptomyces sp. SID8499]|uniref:maleylpyruvate isomerase family mycothiol-dependent enzyme n=1 Tax=unclassified Streptomyces TaxID=2593676 RepID=UPI0013C76199|nr:maleylpyruvate isomerase family mycothiol-dependent enzyme [Streptomyces sp. SID8499]NED31886.1 maleylpyruvate isomerase family mycothiol-dependent enzyme [Streptomyces sp. SID8499]
MKTAEFLDVLDREGRLLAAAAEEAGTDAEVPTCPQWRVRDLLAHTGAVHEWAAAFVADGRTSPFPLGEAPRLDGAELVAWYRDAHRRLVRTLAEAPAEVECWTFHPAPQSPPTSLAFWTRRQAHETAVHRFDAESARGGAPTAIDAGFAVDGVDELLRGFHARPRSRVRVPEPRVLRVRATDAGEADEAVWTVRLSDGPPVTVRDAVGAADAELSGPADRLYLALWNRGPVPSVTGDASLAALWRETSAIT